MFGAAGMPSWQAAPPPQQHHQQPPQQQPQPQPQRQQQQQHFNAAPASPTTDSLLSRFGLQIGDLVQGRFLLGAKHRWYKGVLRYNTVVDARFEHCVYAISYDDGETLFYPVNVITHHLEKGGIRKAA